MKRLGAGRVRLGWTTGTSQCDRLSLRRLSHVCCCDRHSSGKRSYEIQCKARPTDIPRGQNQQKRHKCTPSKASFSPSAGRCFLEFNSRLCEMKRAARRVRRSEFRPSLNSLREKHSIDVVVSSGVFCCWKLSVVLGHSLSNAVLFLPHCMHSVRKVDVFGPYLATFSRRKLHSFWFSPASLANSRASVAIIHLGFTWFHGNNAPGEGNPFIPVRNQSIHTWVCSFSSPVPCRLSNRSLRKPRTTRKESKCAGRFKNSTIAPNSCRTMDTMIKGRLFPPPYLPFYHSTIASTRLQMDQICLTLILLRLSDTDPMQNRTVPMTSAFLRGGFVFQTRLR